MLDRRQRLELMWVGKEQEPRLEPRVLLERPEHSHAPPSGPHASEDAATQNMVIHGDNLLALRALEPSHSGSVRCIYIDPPYNTGSAFEHYADNLEHSLWLSLMRDRLLLLRTLLREDGFLCCHIDDSEGHYLKVLLDEVFGRSNYLATLYVRVRYASKTLKQDMDFHREVEFIHVYRKSPQAKPVRMTTSAGQEKFCHFIRLVAPPTKTIRLGGKSVDVFGPSSYVIEKGEGSEDGLKEIWASGTILDGNSSGRFFRDHLSGRVQEDGLGALYRVEGIGDDSLGYRYFSGPRRTGATKGKYFQGVPTGRNATKERRDPILGFHDLAAAFGNCRHEGGVDFRSGKKPESLLQLLLRHFSSPGDLVLDSFAGSGTTGAVAHKMGRRWILVELGDHCKTHVLPRMKSVVSGDDQTGITDSEGWRGGGGFRFFELAPSLLQEDQWGNWVVSKAYNAEMLAEAVCKLEGFNYAPDPETFWIHGHSTERDFLYVTTQNLSRAQLQFISDEVGEDRTLLICCGSFRVKRDTFPNLTLKKIPQVVLHRCEWGRDDYSLNVKALPSAVDSGENSAEPTTKATTKKTTAGGNRHKEGKRGMQQLPLFEATEQKEEAE